MIHDTRIGALARHDLMTLDDAAFIALWRRLVGEPPAVLLSREEMIDILEQASGSAGAAPTGCIRSAGSRLTSGTATAVGGTSS